MKSSVLEYIADETEKNQTCLLHSSGVDHRRHRQLLHSFAIRNIYTRERLDKGCEDCGE
jgi:hypothetical protein